MDQNEACALKAECFKIGVKLLSIIKLNEQYAIEYIVNNLNTLLCRVAVDLISVHKVLMKC
jgi:hypothetical protein